MKTELLVGGTLIVHNAVLGDYCLREAVLSLNAVCDEVVIVEAGSTDDTPTTVAGLASEIGPKCRVITADWTPSPLGKWLSDLTNLARSHIKAPYHINLQADEVLEEGGDEEIRQFASRGVPLMFQRLNFWEDNWHCSPQNRVCGVFVTRGAPTSCPSVGDAEQIAVTTKAHVPKSRYFHYGFIRKAAGFHYKSVRIQKAFFNTVDPIVERVASEGMGVLLESVTESELIQYRGRHPQIAHAWLTERGYQLTPP